MSEESGANPTVGDFRELERYLAQVADLDAADLYLSVDALPVAKASGKLVPLSQKPLTREQMKRLAGPLLKGRRLEQFRKKPELDLAHEVEGKGRFRINVFMQKGSVAIVARRIKPGIPTLDELNLPPILKRLSVLRQGLLCVTGSTGSGKSTTLAAMVDHRNRTTPGHILTIEDPVEFVHEHRASIVSQREVGRDTAQFKDALRSALRQAPDLLVVGEIRDAETAEAALHFAETGHLVFATLHSTNAALTLDRLVHLFPPEQSRQMYLMMSLNLAGIVAQRLIPTVDGKGRAAALEILVPTARMRDLIGLGDVDGVQEAMRELKGDEGVVTFDDALHRLVGKREISQAQAIRFADMPNDLKLRFRMESQGVDPNLARISLGR